jgi:hypothetical protein
MIVCREPWSQLAIGNRSGKPACGRGVRHPGRLIINGGKFDWAPSVADEEKLWGTGHPCDCPKFGNALFPLRESVELEGSEPWERADSSIRNSESGPAAE